MDLQKALKDELRVSDFKRVLEDELKTRDFVSLEALDRCLTSAQAAKHSHTNRPTTALLDQIVFRARKLFALLVLLGYEHAIEQCLSKGFSDDKFPVWDKSQIPYVGIPHFQQELYRKQWCVPIVLHQDSHLDLPLEFVPPFLEIRYGIDGGGFGVIHKVRVAKGHLPQFDSVRISHLRKRKN